METLEMKLLIVGASRGIGRALLDCAIEEHFEVTVLARTPSSITWGSSSLEILKGDVLDAERVRLAARGKDAVCSCIGCPITFKKVDLFSRGAENLIAAVQENPRQKFVAVTGIGAGETKGHGGFIYDRIFRPLFLNTIYEDKDREEQIIAQSGVDWLIVRPAGLTNGPRTGQYRVINDLKGVTSKKISRLDVADFIIGQLKNPTQMGKKPLLTY
jgi:putative NADH-flavin reductase